MALSTRVWGAGKRLLLGGALILTYFVFAVAAMRVAVKSRDVVVPAVTGKTANEASALLGASGLNLKVEEARRVDATVPPGQIISQDPQAGVRTRRERSVKVWVSAGPRATTVPSLLGDSERTAQLRAQQEGLQLASIAEIRSSDYTAGAVVAQNPPPKTTGTTLALLVNRGERGVTYVMPDLIGVNGDRAADLLRARGFRVSVVGDHPYPGVPAGIVLRQSPQGGFQTGPSDPISALGDAVAKAERGGADLIHVDIMDGHFVPNLTVGPPVVKSLSRIAHVPLDVHLMIEEPDRFVEAFVEAGAASLTVHVEAVVHLHRTVQFIKSFGIRAGVALNPATPVTSLEQIAGDVDYVLVMTVNPGFGGQTFIPRSESKVRAVRELLRRQGSSAPSDPERAIRALRVAAESAVA